MTLHATSVSNNYPATSPKYYYLQTWGCQMNVYDSHRMEDLLGKDNYRPTTDVGKADLIILNTCHIRTKATDKIFSQLGRLKKIKQTRQRHHEDSYIAVTGCVAQAEGEELLRRAPYIDLVLGPQTYHMLPQFIKQVEREKQPVIATEFTTQDKFDTLGAVKHKQPNIHTAFLTIQEGCDKFCRFCVVPYTRGAEISRRQESVIEEAHDLAQQGAKEITLLGQNVNAWHEDDHHLALADLLGNLASIEGITRLRYTTSHPRDMSDSLIEAHRDIEALMPFLHLPVQSGSDKILKAMNRGHTSAQYMDIIRKLRQARPDMGFSSDFIVGYPGERDEDFQATLQLIKDVGFAQSYSFKYSPRPGTPASNSSEQVPEDVKDERLKILQSLLHEQQDTFNQQTVGKTIDVLFTSKGRKDGQIVGRSAWLQPVHVFAPTSLIGTQRPVKINMYMGHSLAGALA